jgi:hypothetical protein
MGIMHRERSDGDLARGTGSPPGNPFGTVLYSDGEKRVGVFRMPGG